MRLHAQGWPFSMFQHVCFYVRDIDETDRFLRTFGMEREEYPYRDHGRFTSIEGLRLDGGDDQEEAFWELGYRHVMIGNVHFQVMSPGKIDTIHKRFVNQYGNRCFSVGFYVADVEYAERELLKKGLRLLWKLRHENGLGSTYFDTIDQLGAHLCVRQSSRYY